MAHLHDNGLEGTEFWLSQLDKKLGVKSKANLGLLEGDIDVFSALKELARCQAEVETLKKLLKISSEKAKEVCECEERAQEEKQWEEAAQEERVQEEKTLEGKMCEEKVLEERVQEGKALEEKVLEENAWEEKAEEKKEIVQGTKQERVKAWEEKVQKERVQEEKVLEEKAQEEIVPNEKVPNENEKAQIKKALQEKAREEKVQEEKLQEGKAQEAKAQEAKAQEAKAQEAEAQEAKAQEAKAQEERAQEEKAQKEKSQEEKEQKEKVQQEKVQNEQAREEKVWEEKAREKQVREEKAQEGKAREERVQEEKKRKERVQEEKAWGERAEEEGDSMLLHKVSGGRALHGILLTKQKEDRLAMRQRLLEAPKEVVIASESHSDTKSFQFSSKYSENNFMEEIDLLRHGAAMSTSISICEAAIGVDKSKHHGAEEDAMHRENYASTINYSTVEVASYSFENKELKLSEDPKGDLREVLNLFQLHGAESDYVKRHVKNSCSHMGHMSARVHSSLVAIIC